MLLAWRRNWPTSIARRSPSAASGGPARNSASGCRGRPATALCSRARSAAALSLLPHSSCRAIAAHLWNGRRRTKIC